MNITERSLHEYIDVLQPRAISQFLAVGDWSARSPRPKMQTWVLDPGSGQRLHAVHLPLDSSLADYDKRLLEAASEIATIYDWSIGELAEQVSSVRADLYFVRIKNSSADGTIPFHQASEVLGSIEKLIRAAATRANNPSASGKGRRAERVREFLEEDLRMGHTKRGSFIITVAARLQDDDSIPLDTLQDSAGRGEAVPELSERHVMWGEDDDPEVAVRQLEATPAPQQAIPDIQLDFTRRVMTTLSRSLAITRRHLAESDDDFLGFDEAVRDGMLAPVVEALDELSVVSEGGGIDMDFQWAPALPQEPEVPVHVEFSSTALERAPRVVRRFKRADDVPQVEDLAGSVVALERENFADTDSGEVVIQATVRGSTRKVRVELSGTDYDWAIVAHHRHLPFRVSGHLGKKGNRWALLDPITVDTTHLQAWQRARIEAATGEEAPAEIEPPTS